MRLPDKARYGALALVTPLLLTGCGIVGGGSRPALAEGGAAPASPAHSATNGPAADYPMVLGAPFTVDGEVYTPADTLNYDRVGYAALDQGAGVTAASKTLPMPSYIEVTSLDTGKTILVRVERRGPMTGARLVALSPAAAAQLGAVDGTPIRVRRVNPPEAERAELRAGRPATERMETPKSLVEVLRRKLPQTGEASLRSAAARETDPSPAPALATRVASAAAEAAPAKPAMPSKQAATTAAYPLLPLAQGPGAPAPKPAAQATAPAKPVAVAQAGADAADGFLIQAGAFSSKGNADRAARSIGGFVSHSGKLYRVQSGPYRTRGQAEAALVKVRAAGYSDARVFTAG